MPGNAARAVAFQSGAVFGPVKEGTSSQTSPILIEATFFRSIPDDSGSVFLAFHKKSRVRTILLQKTGEQIDQKQLIGIRAYLCRSGALLRA